MSLWARRHRVINRGGERGPWIEDRQDVPPAVVVTKAYPIRLRNRRTGEVVEVQGVVHGSTASWPLAKYQSKDWETLGPARIEWQEVAS